MAARVRGPDLLAQPERPADPARARRAFARRSNARRWQIELAGDGRHRSRGAGRADGVWRPGFALPRRTERGARPATRPPWPRRRQRRERDGCGDRRTVGAGSWGVGGSNDRAKGLGRSGDRTSARSPDASSGINLPSIPIRSPAIVSTARRTHGFRESVIRGMSRLAREHQADQPGAGIPQLRRARAAEGSGGASDPRRHQPVRHHLGRAALREAIARKYARWYGLDGGSRSARSPSPAAPPRR